MHLTDDQLNEYLDNETAARAPIELHLSACNECRARLIAFRTLFAEIESLPEVELTHSLAARFATRPSLPSPLPRWLTLTASLQAASALIALIVAAPVIARFLPAIETPTLMGTLIQLQEQWTAWLDTLSTFCFPTMPSMTVPELPSLMLTLTFIGASLFWLVGNGLLLRKKIR